MSDEPAVAVGNGLNPADVDSLGEDSEYEYKRIGWYVEAVRSLYESVSSQILSMVGDEKSMPVAMAMPIITTFSDVLPINAVVSYCIELLKKVDDVADSAILSTSTLAEDTYNTIAPNSVQNLIKEFMWAKSEFQKEFLRQTEKQQEEENIKKSTSNGIGPRQLLQGQASVERIMTAGKRAFTAVAVKKYEKEYSSADSETGTHKQDTLDVEEEKNVMSLDKISVHGIWSLNIDRSEPWDALLEVLGIEHRKVQNKSQIRPSTQEFYHKGDEISHRIYSSSGKPRDEAIEPTVFTIGDPAIEETSPEGDVIQTRYYYSDGGIVQESINPEKDVVVITTRSLEDENTMVQMSVAKRDGKTASVKRIFSKVDSSDS